MPDIVSRQDFLRTPEVGEFINYFRRIINGETTFGHRWTDRNNGNGEAVHFGSLKEALEKYYWDHPEKKYEYNRGQLDLCRAMLRSGAANQDDELFYAGCLAVLKWGGGGRLFTENRKWLDGRRQQGISLVSLFNSSGQQLCRDLPDLAGFGDGEGAQYRMNAGMTKIYSLLLDEFVIYDSRVAAALGLFVRNFLGSHGKGQKKTPPLLAFAWLGANEGPNARYPKLRDPSSDDWKFGRLYRNSANHAWNNIKANWIISEALAGTPRPLKSRKMRETEAALFMIGYDLSESGG